MTKRSRRTHSPAFKAKVALAAIKGEQDAGRAGAAVRRPPQPDHDVERPVARRRGGRFRAGSGRGRKNPPVDSKALHAKIGELTLANDFLSGALGKAGLLSAKR